MSIHKCVQKCVWQQGVWLLTLVALFAGPVAAQRSATYEFINGRWFDGQGFRSKRYYSVNGVLTSKKPVRVDSVIDLSGKYVIPPFGEAHNHNLDWSSDEQFARIKRMYLDDGVFYIKNPNNLPRATAPLRGKINIPTSLDGAFANGGLTASGGHPIEVVIPRRGLKPTDGEGGFYFVIDNVADLDSKWATIKAGHPDFIKTYLIYSEEYEKRKNDEKYFGRKGLNPAILPEIVRRAHRDGLRVSTHVETATDFHNALVAGVDEINHLPGFHLPRPENNDVTDRLQELSSYRISDADARLAAQKKVVVVTTLGETIDQIFNTTSGLKDPTGARELLTHNLQILKQHGVRIAIGSDNFRQTSQPEALNLNRLGAFDNLTLLKAWCETTAATIFPKRKIGFLREGYEASFLVLSGDPLKNFANVQKIELRVKQGEILSSDTDALGARVDAYIKPYLEMAAFSGAILIAKGGEVLVSKGYGMANYELSLPNTPKSRFHLASLSKPFTAAAIMILQERGKLSVNDPLSKYIPDYPNGDKISIHLLLSHKAGLAGDLPNFNDWTAPITLEKLVELVKKAAPVSEPGAKYSYSNNDYRLLAYIIEKVSGQSYGEFLKTAIFDPLDMKDTGHEGATGSLIKNRASGYKPVGVNDLENIYIDWSTKTGNGSLYSTVEDLYKWDRALYTEKILKKSSLETLFTERYGWFVSEQFKRKLMRYGGRSPGYNSDFQRYVNDDVCVVVLSNNYSVTANPIANNIAAMVFGEPYAIPEATKAIHVDAKQLDNYVGRYEGGPDFFIPKAVLTMERKGDQLWMNYSTGADTQLVPLTAAKFLTRPFWATITFVKDEKGDVSQLIYRYSGQDYSAIRVRHKQ
ncbi:MAG: serine hydrolase [Acidobacteriota bacterium]|nr:serine hydrolase [Acidobacteriota bacterium]